MRQARRGNRRGGSGELEVTQDTADDGSVGDRGDDPQGALVTPGTALHGNGKSARGDFQRPYSEIDIRDKFRELARLVLSPEGVQAAEAAIDRADQWTGMNELTEVVRRYGRL